MNEMYERLTAIPNRSLLYDIYQYTWDVKEAAMLMDSFVSWLGVYVCVCVCEYVTTN